jgi:hypothetical protein
MKKFYSIFKDGNDWNEKSIVGFMSFFMMGIFAFADLGTSICCDKDLIISDTIYNSFVWVTLGAFGIDGIKQTFNNSPKTEEDEAPKTFD